MLFAEGGQVPTYMHGTKAEAQKQASTLSDELKKRVYILCPIEYMDYQEVPVAEMIAQSDEMLDGSPEDKIAPDEFIYTPGHKKKRKRIPVKVNVKK